MWFTRKIEEKVVTEKASKVEIVAHKKATKQQINEVKKANESLNTIFAENHFTLKIFLASGGKHSTRKVGT